MDDEDRRVSMTVCNHVGFFDVLVLIFGPICPGFTPKESLAEVPVLAALIRGLQSIFVSRGANEAERELVVKQIMDRQSQIEDEGAEFQPLCLFAEGSTTNNSHLIKFKRGAFQAMRTVQPCFIKFDYGMVNPCYDTIDFWHLIILMISSLGLYKSHLYIMPPFTPNEYMLEKHADKGTEDWEIFAWCVRDAMAKTGNFAISDQPLREKLQFERFMKCEVDEITYNGKTYTAKDAVIKKKNTEQSQPNQEPLL